MDKVKKILENRPEITLEEIVAIRESLGLTRAEAGKLLGGGPSAYAKYEAGIVKPAAAGVNLLRLLRAYPEMLGELRDGGLSAMTPKASSISPFVVSGKDIGNLPREDLPRLLRQLLAAEAETHNLPADGIHVADNADAADGGEDGRITWKGGPGRTRFLPSRRCQFQLKGGPVQPAQAGREVLAKDGSVKDMVRKFLENGGHYIMLCAKPYPQKAIEKREESIRAALRGAGLDTARDRIQFREASQIAAWTNSHPAVAAWVKEKAEPGIRGPFRSWSHWAGRAEHSTRWIEDDRLPEFRDRLLEHARQSRSIVRIVGPYGIGKSRLTLQALEPTGAARLISNLVRYADESEAGPHAIGEVVQSLADTGGRVVLVVNRCSPKLHQTLENIVLRQGSQLSLITIDDEESGASSGKAELIKVLPPAVTVIEAIINREAPGLPREDCERLVRFSAGIPAIALRIARAWLGPDSLAQAADDDLIDTVVLGRHAREPELLRKTAALLAIFGQVDLEAENNGELGIIAQLSGLTINSLYAAMQNLATRRVIHRRGGLMLFPFSPIAAWLAKRQWDEWPRSTWDEVLAGGVSRSLDLRAVRRLARLNDTAIAREVAAHVCRTGGPLDGILEDASSVRIEMLAPLAETNAKAVTEFLERSLDQCGDEAEIRGSVGISQALNRIAFRSDTFEDGARLLLRLAARSKWNIDDHADHGFIDLFPVYLGNTEANGKARLAFLDWVIEEDRPEERPIIVEALTAGLKTSYFTRGIGDEIHGSRPALEPWFPATYQEIEEYISGCADRILRFAERSDEIGSAARANLGGKLRGLVCIDLIDTVENAVDRVRNVAGCWSDAIDSLGQFLIYDASDKDQASAALAARVQRLIERLKPQELEERGRFLVTEMPFDYPENPALSHKERTQAQLREISELAAEFTKHPEMLRRFLPQISRGQQRMAFEFGRELAAAADPLDWLEPIVLAATEAAKEERNFSLLCGYLDAIREKHPEAVEYFKHRVGQSPELAPALPLVCRNCGIDQADIRLVMDLLQTGQLSPQHLRTWEASTAFANVPAVTAAPLFNWLLSSDKPEAFHVGVCLLEPYACEKPRRLNQLRPQIRLLAENAVRHRSQWDGGLLRYHFERIMRKVLEKGWEDSGARAAALALAKGLVNMGRWGSGDPTRSVLPSLLSDFTEIVWPVLGQAIAADPDRRDRFMHVLGSRLVDTGEPPPILSLPEEILFEWCREHPNRAPAFAASVAPVLATSQDDSSDRTLHPILSRLIDEFGERKDMQEVITRRIHMHCFSGSGPSDQRYELLSALLEPLHDRHPRGSVRRWIRSMLDFLREHAEADRRRTEEREAQWEV